MPAGFLGAAGAVPISRFAALGGRGMSAFGACGDLNISADIFSLNSAPAAKGAADDS